MAAAAGLARGAGGRWVRWRWLAPLAFAVAGLTFGWFASTHRPVAANASPGMAASGARGGGLAALSRLSPQAQSVISSTVAAGDARFAPARGPAGFGLSGGGTAATLDRGKVRIDGGGVRLSLGGLAFGRAGRLRPLAAMAPRARGDRVVYARGSGVSEWYAAGPLGLEQGFTLSRRPAGPSGAVTLAQALGGLPARMSGTGVEFSARSGRVALRYGGLVASDARGRRLSARLSLSGSRLLLRVADRGARYPLRIDPFIQQGSKLTGANESGPGQFGRRVAVSGDGGTVLVGGPSDNGSGSAWVFTRAGGTWTQQGPKLTAPASAELFGWSVALSWDGNTALIGAPFTNGEVGAAYVFVRSGNKWAQQGSALIGTGRTSGAAVGWSVALSGDGNTALIGGSGDNNDVGAAWVFSRSGSTWTQRGAKLTASDESGQGFFGWSVALSGDGGTGLIGGFGDNEDTGAAWVFEPSGGTWTQQGPKLSGPGPGPWFGYSVALDFDGATALIGSPRAGAATVFTRSGTTWTQQGPTLTPSESPVSNFGSSTALSSDGDTALIGGNNSDNNNPNVGANVGWVFGRSGSTWTQQGPVLTPTSESGQGVMGAGVAMSDDGGTALIGGPGDNNNAGAVWAFGSPAPPGNLYWDNPQGGTIGRDTADGNPANLNQSFITGIQAAGAVGIAVDGQHIYWTNGTWIGRANLDGSHVNQQFVQTGEGVELLAVDALHIYWAVRGGSHIGRANLDGSQPNSQFMSTVNPGGPGSSVEGLAVDGSYLYWVDSGPHTQNIGRAKLDGTGVNQTFIFTAPDNPTAVAVSSQHIYWASPERLLGSGGDLGQANVDGTDVSPGVEGPPEQTGVPAELQGLAVDSGDAGDANLYGAFPSGGAIAQMQLPEGRNTPAQPVVHHCRTERRAQPKWR